MENEMRPRALRVPNLARPSKLLCSSVLHDGEGDLVLLVLGQANNPSGRFVCVAI
jgi:hypothetical protein